MMSIQSILNPSPSSSSSSSPFEHGHQPGSSSIHTSGPPGPPSHKKQKMSKDGVISREGEIRGEIRYGPHETEDEEIIAQHRRLQIPPLDEIRRSCRHIPYNSEKTQFSEKTGRTAFDGRCR